jgi:hypothetical protein
MIPNPPAWYPVPPKRDALRNATVVCHDSRRDDHNHRPGLHLGPPATSFVHDQLEMAGWQGADRAAVHAARHPIYAERYRRTKARLSRQRGPKIAQINLARRLSEAIWHMLTTNRPFAPAGAAQSRAS